MLSDNHFPSTDHLLPTPQCEIPTQQLVEVDQDRCRLSQDGYSLLPVSQHAMPDSISPMGGFSSLPPIKPRKRSLAEMRT